MTEERAKQLYYDMFDTLHSEQKLLRFLDEALREERRLAAVEACRMMLDFWNDYKGVTAISDPCTVTKQWIDRFRKHFELTEDDVRNAGKIETT